MSIGVSYEDFWEITPRILNVYVKANNERKRQNDYDNWVLGQYILSAVASCFDKKSKYPAKPFLEEHFETLNMSQEEYDRRELEKMLKAQEQWAVNDEKIGLSAPKI